MRLADWLKRDTQPMRIPWEPSTPSESKGCSVLGLPASDQGDGRGAEWRAGQCGEPAQQVRSLWGSRKA